jgi:hypothetical protein
MDIIGWIYMDIMIYLYITVLLWMDYGYYWMDLIYECIS